MSDDDWFECPNGCGIKFPHAACAPVGMKVEPYVLRCRISGELVNWEQVAAAEASERWFWNRMQRLLDEEASKWIPKEPSDE